MDPNFFATLGAAFLGGLILNVMPCVLPVLTMKVFHLIEHSRDDASRHRVIGLSYTAGVVATFVAFGVIIIGLKTSGEMVGWGMQFQNPSFVVTLTAFLLVLGLNALGVFEFNVSMQTGESRGEIADSFMNGIVASIMSMPCSAPFLGAAAGYALGSDANSIETMLVFIVIGLGLASPFTLVSFIPAIGKLLPKPGAWMETFKHLMGFTLIGAAIWLYHSLQSQLTPESANSVLVVMLAAGVAAWMIGRFGGPMSSERTRLVARFGAVALVAATVLGWMTLEPASDAYAPTGSYDQVVIDDEINWAPFDPEVVELAAAANRPVFMDYTADWCANCKANERLFIEVPEVRAVLEDTRILPMVADWTDGDEEIGEWLQELGRAGIPVYAIYMPNGEIDLLPQAITTDILVQRLNAASELFPPENYGSMEPAAQECVCEASECGEEGGEEDDGDSESEELPEEEAAILDEHLGDETPAADAVARATEAGNAASSGAATAEGTEETAQDAAE